VPQDGQQLRREHHLTITVAFALVDTDDAAVAIEVTQAEVTQLAQAHAGIIERGENRSMLEAAGRHQQRGHVGMTEDSRQFALSSGIGDVPNHLWPPQRIW
jgi:hypothetical protein